MSENKIKFNKITGKYEIGNIALSCGTCLDVWNGEEWLTCRVEYNRNWHRGYYLVVFRNGIQNGEIPLWDKEKARIL